MDIPRTGRRKKPTRYLLSIGIGAALVVVLAIGRMSGGAPAVSAAAIDTDTVKRGWFVREVRAAGVLVPEQVRWLAAVSAGRIERVHVQPGAEVKAGTLLLEMSNPDVRLEVLQAERDLASAEAALVTLGASIETQQLSQAAVLASVRSQQRDATRKAKANAELVEMQMITRLEAAQSADQATEMNERLKIEEDRLRIVGSASKTQLHVQRAEIQRLRDIAAFQRARHDALMIRASSDGVVQEIPSETGQWADPGQTLVKMQGAGPLKAVLRVPELEAKDVSPGQTVVVDTRNGIVKGRVSRVSPSVQGGIVTVDVALPHPLPRGARADLSIDGVIEVERVANALHVGRAPDATAHGSAHIFKLVEDDEAIRLSVGVGRLSASRMEVTRGLKAGDVVIVSMLPIDPETERITIRH